VNSIFDRSRSALQARLPPLVVIASLNQSQARMKSNTRFQRFVRDIVSYRSGTPGKLRREQVTVEGQDLSWRVSILLLRPGQVLGLQESVKPTRSLEGPEKGGRRVT